MSPPPAPPRPDVPAAVRRARWAVLQTGLMTSGLALFGVYVMSTRTNDLHLMNFYWPAWLPAGPMAVALIASSGYLLCAWWLGVRMNARVLLTIAVLQLSTWMVAQYTDFQSQELLYADTGEPAGFLTYFHYTTTHVAVENQLAPLELTALHGYGRRGMEALIFLVMGMTAGLVLVGQRTCPACRGLIRRRALHAVPIAEADRLIVKLDALAQAGDRAGAEKELQGCAIPASQTVAADLDSVVASSRPADTALPPPMTMQIALSQCDVCGLVQVEPSSPAVATATSPPSAQPESPSGNAGGFPLPETPATAAIPSPRR